MEDNALKQRILKVATFEFFTTGIRPVTMDSLSRKLKMSKRTLYEIFKDKEELLCESLVLRRKLPQEDWKYSVCQAVLHLFPQNHFQF